LLSIQTSGECTQTATVFVGDVAVASFRTHTKYPDTSLEVAESLVADMLRSFLKEAISKAMDS
jgi:hypothetical protein